MLGKIFASDPKELSKNTPHYKLGENFSTLPQRTLSDQFAIF
jgi:hypothetical protein